MFINDFYDDSDNNPTVKKILGTYYEKVNLNVDTDDEGIKIIIKNKENKSIASINLHEFPGCCTFLVAHDIFYYVKEADTYKLVQRIKEKLAEHYDYTAIIQTTIEEQELEIELLIKNGYELIFSVESVRTDNLNKMWIKLL